MDRLRKLGYDVAVNVAANLIAAGIIYLLGAWFGLFPANTAAITVAVAILLGAGGYGTILVGGLFGGRHVLLTSTIGLFLLGLALVGLSIFLVLSYPVWIGFLTLLIGALMTALAWAMAREEVRTRRRGRRSTAAPDAPSP